MVFIFFLYFYFIPFLFDFYGRKKPDSFPGLLHILRCFEPYEPCTEVIHVFWIHIFFIHWIGNISRHEFSIKKGQFQSFRLFKNADIFQIFIKILISKVTNPILNPTEGPAFLFKMFYLWYWLIEWFWRRVEWFWAFFPVKYYQVHVWNLPSPLN